MKEAKFLNLKETYEERISHYRRLDRILTWVGVGSIVTGAFFSILFIISNNMDESSMLMEATYLYLVLLIIFAGAGLFLIFFSMFYLVRKRNDYRKLLEDLLDEGYDKSKKATPRNNESTKKKEKSIKDPLSKDYIPPEQR